MLHWWLKSADPNTAKRLGHASSQMTLDTYSHTTAVGEVKLLISLQIIWTRVESFQDGTGVY